MLVTICAVIVLGFIVAQKLTVAPSYEAIAIKVERTDRRY